jgi:hypothetical protein
MDEHLSREVRTAWTAGRLAHRIMHRLSGARLAIID